MLIFYGKLLTMPLVLIPAWPAWTWPEALQWPALLVAGFFGMIAHIFMTRAYALADASIIVPIDFAKLLFAALFGRALISRIVE